VPGSGSSASVRQAIVRLVSGGGIGMDRMCQMSRVLLIRLRQQRRGRWRWRQRVLFEMVVDGPDATLVGGIVRQIWCPWLGQVGLPHGATVRRILIVRMSACQFVNRAEACSRSDAGGIWQVGSRRCDGMRGPAEGIVGKRGRGCRPRN